MAWKCAAYIPRIVAIKTVPIKQSQERSLISTRPPSPLLLTTTKALAEALKVFRPLTRSCYTAKGMILTNPLGDTVWILCGQCTWFQKLRLCPPGFSIRRLAGRFLLTPLITRLALPYQFWKEAEDNNKTLVLLDNFKNLTSVKLFRSLAMKRFANNRTLYSRSQQNGQVGIVMRELTSGTIPLTVRCNPGSCSQSIIKIPLEFAIEEARGNAISSNCIFFNVNDGDCWHEGELGVRHVMKSSLADFDLLMKVLGYQSVDQITRESIDSLANAAGMMGEKSRS